MNGISLEGIAVRLGSFALNDISFSLDAGETFVILGPSGAGKSVLLETIAGFYHPETGQIKIGGRDVTNAPPEARRVGLMFQDYALFPHLTVTQNIRFARHVTLQRAHELLARLGLEHIADRKPINLSGGEKQRVALARALAMDPELFLFDEPFSALDAPTRDSLREELKALLQGLGVPSIYVTHDQTEALALADHIAVLRSGHLEQTGTPAEIFNTPTNEFVANFVGVETVLPGRIIAADDGIVSVDLGGAILHTVARDGSNAARDVLACIRPEDVSLSRQMPTGLSTRNHFAARVTAVASLGPFFKISLDAGFPLVAYVTKQSYLELELAPNTSVVASIKATAVHLIQH